MHNYHKESKEKKCTIKIDLLKAYDFLNQDFIRAVHYYWFSFSMHWLDYDCDTILSFLISMNKELMGFFNSSKKLKQMDPFSPYFFVMAIEVLSYMLGELKNNENFNHNWKCKKKLT